MPSRFVVRDLAPSELPGARALLARACPYDRAGAVAAALLFEPSLAGPPRALAAVDGDRLCGVAAVGGACLRVLAVEQDSRGCGVGSALLRAAERAVTGPEDRPGTTVVRVLGEPGNYLAPGVDLRNADAIAWLERRGYRRVGERTSLIVDVAGNPRVTADRAGQLAERCGERGHAIRRARPGDRDSLTTMIEAEFSAGWAFEVGRALSADPPAVHVAEAAGRIVAFAAHDGGPLGRFGPAGTLPAARGLGLGKALLLACLLDVAAAGHRACEISWIGPREFYQRAAGVVGERRFAALEKELVP